MKTCPWCGWKKDHKVPPVGWTRIKRPMLFCGRCGGSFYTGCRHKFGVSKKQALKQGATSIENSYPVTCEKCSIDFSLYYENGKRVIETA